MPLKTPYNKLKYTKYYPLKVRNWVRDMRTPKGFYDEYGFWRDTGIPIPPIDSKTLANVFLSIFTTEINFHRKD